MKNCFFVICSIISFAFGVNGQNCTGSMNILFSRQGLLDSFNINYPNCNNITGNLIISGPITNLDSLKYLTNITGALIIENTNLTNLIGLENLDSINLLEIRENKFLENLKGMGGLIYIDFFVLKSNDSLKEINDISKADIINFSVSDCLKLKEIVGFNTSKLMTGINISDNSELERINAFNAVEVIAGRFRLFSNINLKNLDTGSKLKMVKGFLEIVNLKNISELPSFDSLEMAHRISILNLDNISFLPEFFKLKLVKGNINIGSNNHVFKFSYFPSLKIIEGSLEIGLKKSIIDFDGFTALDTILGSLRILGSSFDMTEKISGFKNLKYIGQDFLISELFNLNEITGFSSLQKVTRSVKLNLLVKIQNLDAFKNLSSATILNISSCWLLNDISGVTGIDFTKLNNFHLSGNDSLSYCHYEPICTYIDQNLGKHDIKFNKKGCNSAEEILEACRTVGVEEWDEVQVSIYPNPTCSHFYIESDTDIDIDDVEIWTMAGSKVPFSKVGDAIYPIFQDGGLLIVKIKISGKTLVKKILYLQ